MGLSLGLKVRASVPRRRGAAGCSVAWRGVARGWRGGVRGAPLWLLGDGALKRVISNKVRKMRRVDEQAFREKRP